MIDTKLVQAFVGDNVFEYGTDYDFAKPAAFIQVSTDKVNSFSFQCSLEVWIVGNTKEDIEEIESRFDNVFVQGFLTLSIYVYSVSKKIEDESLLSNGYQTKKIIYDFIFEEGE